jgi:hypothetical protein
MKASDYISFTINRLPKGYVFTYSDFDTTLNNKEAVIKALNRLAALGKIIKLSKGKFYKPETSPFGILQPNQFQLVKDLLETNGKVTGYLTGYSIYYQLGLTTQISNTIQVGKNEIRPTFKRDRYTISIIRQRNTITKETIPLLQLLDAIRYIKKIPDTTVVASFKRFLVIINELSEKDKNTMVRLAQKYPPVTRALSGALLEITGNSTLAEPLRKSLNSITAYKLSDITTAFPVAERWNIK